MMYWHFGADVKAAEGCGGRSFEGACQARGRREEAEGKKRSSERRKRRWRVATNTRERFGRLSKTFIIFDVNYQTL